MRSLLEKYRGLPQNQSIGKAYIHSCGADGGSGREQYLNCDVCQVFGVPGERGFSTPPRLVVRDVKMTQDSVAKLKDARTDLPFTEVKTEVSIDRVTSAANPRQMERVPAGTVFGQAELVFSIYQGDDCDARQDVERLCTLIEGLQLLEDDYLGGLGSRGSGKVRLKDIRVMVRSGTDYLKEPDTVGQYDSLSAFAADANPVLGQVRQALGV